jgi:carbon storage regulator
MLVLSRHRDESIIIGDDIVITVVDIRGDKVRLGISAPIEVSVHRQEVFEAIQRENRARASDPAPPAPDGVCENCRGGGCRRCQGTGRA